MRFFFIAVYFFIQASLLFGNIDVRASIDKNLVYMDETITYSLTIITEGERIKNPKFPVFNGFSARRTRNQSQMSFINGTKSNRYDIAYQLKPESAGVYEISPTVVLVGGQKYESEAFNIEIKKGYNPNYQTSVSGYNQRANQLSRQSSRKSPNANLNTPASSQDKNSDLAFVKAELDKKECFIYEQVTFTFSFYRRVSTLGDVDYNPPDLQDFWVQDIRPVKEYYEFVDGVRYHVTSIHAALFPMKAGSLKVGSAYVDCIFPNSQRRGSTLFDLDSFFDSFINMNSGKEVRLRTSPISLKVNSLPAVQPDDFCGSVGSFEIFLTRENDKIPVKVGQAVNLKVSFGGKGWVKGASLPKMPKIKGVQSYETDPKFDFVSEKDFSFFSKKSYEIVFVPEEEGDLQVPSLSLTFFNPEEKIYKTVKTDSFILKVKPSTGPSSEKVLDYGEVQENKETRISKSSIENLRYLRKDLGRSLSLWQIWSKRNLLIFFTMCPLIAVLGSFFAKKYKSKRSDSKKKSKRALAKALNSLEQISSQKKSQQIFYTELSDIIRNYVGERLNVPEQSLTWLEISKILYNNHVSEKLVKDLEKVLNSASYARFGGEDVDVMINADIDKLKNILKQIEKVVGK
ncbi:hypothetical protein AB834_06180 [PVC group bacterium (ex Bugula neritina AB1)]|nr:hypothetical protein AB834_06180 [PVC group bacterium (ex Bugula neritina AB1)]